MSNHFHIVLHVDPARARAWSDAEVSERYGHLFPRTVRQAQALPEGTRTRLVGRWRTRLWDLSWFMRCVNESIARRANEEDACTGRFWEGRFRSQALLDVGALLTCMAYVDLNPIRAGVATTLDGSDWTSIQARLLAAARAQAATPTGLLAFADQAATGGEPIPFAFADYVEVLQWTATALTASDAPLAPDPVAGTLARVGLAREGFVASLRTYARTFRTMVGHVHRIDAESRRRGYRRRPSIRAARRLYGDRAA